MSEEAPDCGDNSCLFGGAGKGGMRTNGGCRCLKDLPATTRRYFQRLYSENAELRKQLEHLSDKYNTVECTADAWKIRAEKAESKLEQAETLCMWKL